MFGPTLPGARLTLRGFRVSDLPHFRRWFADPEIIRFWWTHDVRRARWPGLAAFLFFARASVGNSAIFWTIELGGKPVGHTHIRQIDRASGHAIAAVLIGERAEHGKGVAGEAIAIRNAYVFRRLGLNKIKASAFDTNVATRRLLEKAGYRLVGTAREDSYLSGERRDVLLFELLRADWERMSQEREH